MPEAAAASRAASRIRVPSRRPTPRRRGRAPGRAGARRRRPSEAVGRSAAASRPARCGLCSSEPTSPRVIWARRSDRSGRSCGAGRGGAGWWRGARADGAELERLRVVSPTPSFAAAGGRRPTVESRVSRRSGLLASAQAPGGSCLSGGDAGAVSVSNTSTTDCVRSSRSRAHRVDVLAEVLVGLGKVARADAEEAAERPPLAPERALLTERHRPPKRSWARMIASASVAWTHAYASGSSEW